MNDDLCGLYCVLRGWLYGLAIGLPVLAFLMWTNMTGLEPPLFYLRKAKVWFKNLVHFRKLID